MHDEIMAAIRARADSGARVNDIIGGYSDEDVARASMILQELVESGTILRIQGVNEVRYFPMPEALTAFVADSKRARECRVIDNKTTTKPDAVNHPAHYNTGKLEVITVIEDWKLDFNLGNAVKYIARARHKGKVWKT
jgi:hypothetical protein